MEIRRAQIDGVHAPAHEVAYRGGLALVAKAEALTHLAARPVGGDEVIGLDLEARTIGDPLDAGPHAVALVGEVDEPHAIVDRGAGVFLGMAAQHRLDEFLRHAMR